MTSAAFIPPRPTRGAHRVPSLVQLAPLVALVFALAGPAGAQSTAAVEPRLDSTGAVPLKQDAASADGAGRPASGDSVRPDSARGGVSGPATDTAKAATAPAKTAAGPLTSLPVSLLLISLLGAVGGLAADLITDGGRLDRWSRDDRGWLLGFPAKMLVGAVAALITLALNRADDNWVLVGTALAAGVGGEAILLAIVNSKRAEAAKKDAEQARQQTKTLHEAARVELRAVVAAASAAHPAPLPIGARRAGVDGRNGDGMEPDPHSVFASVLAAQLDGAEAQLAAVAAPPTLP